MRSAQPLRRSATVLGGIFVALALAGPASGQTPTGPVDSGMVDSAVAATAETVEPETEAVAGALSKAVEPVVTTVSTAASAVDASAATTKAVTRTTAPAVRPVASTVAKTAEAASRTARPAKRLVSASAGAATRSLEATPTVLPGGAGRPLGPLVESVDGQAEEVVHGLPATEATGLGEPRETATMPPISIRDAGPAFSRSPFAWATIRPSFPTLVGGPPAARPDAAAPPGAGGTAGAESKPSSPQRAGPTAPAFSGGSPPGFAVAFAVLAGLMTLALAAGLGRLLSWSDAIRPLAFPSPPERPG